MKQIKRLAVCIAFVTTHLPVSLNNPARFVISIILTCINLKAIIEVIYTIIIYNIQAIYIICIIIFIINAIYKFTINESTVIIISNIFFFVCELKVGIASKPKYIV